MNKNRIEAEMTRSSNIYDNPPKKGDTMCTYNYMFNKCTLIQDKKTNADLILPHS